MVTELTVFSDYQQIHLLDSESASALADEWSDSALLDHLALAHDAVGICTGVNGEVTVVIEVSGAAPVDDTDAFDTVTECSLRSGSGTLRLTSPTYGEDDGDLVTVPKGWLRLRMSLTNSPMSQEFDQESDDPAGRQRVRIQCWPAEPADAVFVKGWNPETGSWHPAPTD
ncbi:hypothetical protein ABZ413_03585 [Nocardia rhamnosiphila]|uniref:hypothetical protein n=1 Tax=Nocardia rhamnosiphila TaxID=426716 RepID=UPI0033F37EE2